MTAVTPFPDQLSGALFARLTGRIRADLDRTALEAVTGRRSDITLAANGRNGQVAHVMRLAEAGEAAATRLAPGTGRYEQAGAALRSIRASADAVRMGALTAADAGAGAIADTARTAGQALSGVLGTLNVSFDGRRLFAGAGAGAGAGGPAVADAETLNAGLDAALAAAPSPAGKRAALDAYFGPGGGFEAEVYLGADADAAVLRLPDGSPLSEIPRADGEGIRDLLKGLAMLANATELPPMAMADWVRQGADLIRGGAEALVAEEARIGTSLSRLDAAEARLSEERLSARAALDRIIGRDAFEAASETQALEQRLQAAYTVTSRLGRLSLTSYLR